MGQQSQVYKHTPAQLENQQQQRPVARQSLRAWEEIPRTVRSASVPCSLCTEGTQERPGARGRGPAGAGGKGEEVGGGGLGDQDAGNPEDPGPHEAA